MQVVATSTTSGNSCERITFQLNFRDCHAKIRQVDSHETLANGVVVQVLSLNLHFTFLTSFPLLSFMSQTHKLGERRALEQWGADEEVHADLCSRPTEPQEVLCPQWHLPLPGRGENFDFFFFKSFGIACRGLFTYLYSPLFIHFYTYIPFKLCSKVFNEGEESVGTSSLPLDSAEIEPAQIKVFHLFMRLCV